MATPVKYKIIVKRTVVAWNELFLPGRQYVVSPRVYESIVDGEAFKDLCASVEPVMR